MSGVVKIKIAESIETLKKLLNETSTPQAKERVQAIYWLKTRTVETVQQVALLYCPEVNPIERVWKEIKKYLRWQLFDELDVLREANQKIIDKLNDTVIFSLAHWDFIIEALSVAGI
jgi:hypothetical protein